MRTEEPEKDPQCGMTTSGYFMASDRKSIASSGFLLIMIIDVKDYERKC